MARRIPTKKELKQAEQMYQKDFNSNVEWICGLTEEDIDTIMCYLNSVSHITKEPGLEMMATTCSLAQMTLALLMLERYKLWYKSEIYPKMSEN